MVLSDLSKNFLSHSFELFGQLTVGYDMDMPPRIGWESGPRCQVRAYGANILTGAQSNTAQQNTIQIQLFIEDLSSKSNNVSLFLGSARCRPPDAHHFWPAQIFSGRG
jgi:hypothetical protein